MSVPPAVQIVDDAILKSQLKAMDFKALCGDTQDMSVADIIERMTRSKADAEELKRRNAPPGPYVPPGGWKEKGSLRLTKVVAPTHRTEDHSINRFHLPVPKWDRDQFPDALMVKVSFSQSHWYLQYESLSFSITVYCPHHWLTLKPCLCCMICFKMKVCCIVHCS